MTPYSHTVQRWNFARLNGIVFTFLQENPLGSYHHRTKWTAKRHTRNYASASYLRLSSVSQSAVPRTMCHVGTKNVKAFIAPSSELKWRLTLKKALCPYFQSSARVGRSMGEEAINSIDFSHTRHRAWSTINELTGRSALSYRLRTVSAMWSLQNLWKTGHTRPGTTSPPGATTRISPPFRVYNFWFHFPGIYTPHRVDSRNLVMWFSHFRHAPTRNLHYRVCKVPIVVIPYAGNAIWGHKELLPCIPTVCPFKIFKRVTHTCIEPVIDLLLLQEQVGFRHGVWTVDHVTLLTADFEDSFSV